MLAVSPVRRADVEECGGGAGMAMEEIGLASDLDFDFTVDDIDFGDFFLRLEDGDALPDLEVDPAEIFTDFDAMTSVADDGFMDQEVPSVQPLADEVHIGAVDPCSTGVENTASPDVEEGKGECNPAVELVAGNCDFGGSCGTIDAEKSPSSTTSLSQEAESPHKSSSKHSQGKKKAKVDWTPELHRRFVQAVEQLGIDKAVPSRILEIMGIDSLTRHNIASYLQKYRSHRKHMLVREAEAASWTQLRQLYAAGGAPTAVKRPDSNAWTVPTIGFPPPPPPPPPAPHHPMQHFSRPLHVWGHPTPTLESPRVPIWPRHLVVRAPTPTWAPPPPSDPAFWHHHPYMRGPSHMPPDQVAPCVAVPMPAAVRVRSYCSDGAQHQGPSHMPPGQVAPCVAVPMPAARFPVPPVRRDVLQSPPPMYRPLVPPALAGKSQQDPQLQLHTQPSSESIDAAIGDVLTKPWLPLPLGLKPPSVDSVMGELQRQGVANVLPACG